MSLFLPVSRQAADFALAGALGLGLGLWYDILRLLRLRRAAPADGLLVLTFLAVLLGFVLYPGGGWLRGFVLLALALGAGLYFLTLSPLLRPGLDRLGRRLGRLAVQIRRPGRFARKKLFSFAKKLFHSPEKWFTISASRFSRGSTFHRRGGRQLEVSEIHAARQAGNPDSGCVRYRYPP